MTASAPSASSLPLDRIDLDVLRATRMERARGSSTVPFLLETATGPYVLKVPKAPRGWLKTRLRHWIGSPAFAWQVAVGEALDLRSFEAFRYPKIVQTDASTYCVFEFVAGRHAYDLDEADRQGFLRGLLEFQLSGIEIHRKGLGARMLGAISGQVATVGRRSVAIASHLGPSVAVRCLRAMAWCRGRQPRLPEPILVHNDLHPENVILGPERRPHVMDFEGVTLERRWVLVDVVHFAMATGRSDIDTDLIRDYLAELRSLRPRWTLDLAAQLRFALLKRTLDHLGSLASPPDVREAYRAFLIEVLLDDAGFAGWMARNAFATAWPASDAREPIPPTPSDLPPLLALFVPELSGGGAERVSLELARGFVGRGFRADLVVLRREGALAEQIPEGVRVVELGPDRARSSVPALVGYLRRERPEALFSSAEHGSIAALAARRLTRVGTRSVIAVHTTVSEKRKGAVGFKRRLTPVLFAAAVRAADRIVAVSDGAADDLASFARIDRSRIDTIPNPVDVRVIRARGAETPDHPWLAPGSAPLIVSVGRLSVEKDHATLVRAFARLPDAYDARLLILGEGPERVRLDALAIELGVDERVRMPGFVGNPHAFVARADVFVLSSRREALPMALAEALALGVPIVSTDCVSGPRAMLRDGAYGRLVPVGDPPALATAIRQTLEHPGGYDRDEAARPFAFDATVDAYLRVAGAPASAVPGARPRA